MTLTPILIVGSNAYHCTKRYRW